MDFMNLLLSRVYLLLLLYIVPYILGTDDIYTVQEVGPPHTVAYVAALTREWPLASRFTIYSCRL